MTRLIALVDMDAFFAECERLKDPSLKGRPLVVVADRKRRGVILTSSYEARAYGVRTGMLLGEALSLCPRLVVAESDHRHYLAVSERIEHVLTEFTDRVEMSSVDEAFLDLTESASYFKLDGEPLGRRIQQRLAEDPGLPATIGLAPNRLLAKLMTDFAKPNGVRQVLTPAVPALLEGMPVEKLCGIGKRLTATLANMGVRTVGDLRRVPRETLMQKFGVFGWTLYQMGIGESSDHVARPEDPDTVKSVGHAHTLPADSADPEVLNAYLRLLSDKVAARMRRYGFAAHCVTATVRDADFNTVHRQKRLERPVSSGFDIHRIAFGLVDALWRERSATVAACYTGTAHAEHTARATGRATSAMRATEHAAPPGRVPIRLLGVSVSGLTELDNQLSLFESDNKRRRLEDAMDAINRKHGTRTLKPASVLTAETFGILPTPIPFKKKAADG